MHNNGNGASLKEKNGKPMAQQSMPSLDSLPPSPIRGVEIRCPTCKNLYGVAAMTMGTVEIKCTRPQCKKVNDGLFTITIVSVPQAVEILSSLVRGQMSNSEDFGVMLQGAMMSLTKPGASIIIRR